MRSSMYTTAVCMYSVIVFKYMFVIKVFIIYNVPIYNQSHIDKLEYLENVEYSIKLHKEVNRLIQLNRDFCQIGLGTAKLSVCCIYIHTTQRDINEYTCIRDIKMWINSSIKWFKHTSVVLIITDSSKDFCYLRKWWSSNQKPLKTPWMLESGHYIWISNKTDLLNTLAVLIMRRIA